MRLDFSHPNEHRFRYNFQGCLNPLCSCSLKTEDTIHYNSVKYIFEDFGDFLSDNAKKDLPLYEDPRFDINKNKYILEASLFYITLRVIIVTETKSLLPKFLYFYGVFLQSYLYQVVLRMMIIYRCL